MNTGKREAELLRLLTDAEGSLRLDAAAQKLGVSEKTVRRDLARLDRELAQTGCSICLERGMILFESSSQEQLASLLNLSEEMPETQMERVWWLAGFFLSDGTATISHLADILYVSESTIKNDIQLLKQELQPWNIELVRCRQGLRLQGSEAQIRSCTLSLIRSRKLLPDSDLGEGQIEQIRQSLETVLQSGPLVLSESGLANLFLHIQVAALRVARGKTVEVSHQAPPLFRDTAREIAGQVSKSLALQLPEGEIENLAWHIAAQKRRAACTLVHDEASLLERAIREGLLEADRIYQAGLASDAVLINGLLAHLEVVQVRLQHNMQIDNPILAEIRSQYPYAMELASILARRLEAAFGTPVPLGETGFLAVHIGGALARKQHGASGRMKTAVVCTTGLGTSLLLLARINEQFSDRLDVIGTFTLRQALALNKEEADLILSTINLPESTSLPWVRISPLMSGSDVQKINTLIRRNRFSESVQDLFHDDLFFADLPIADKWAVLDFLSGKLLEAGIVDEEARASFAKREALGTTEISPYVAVPHCMEGTVYEPAIAAAVLKEPIEWEYGLVQVVIMIALSQDFLQKENGFFLKLYTRLSDPALIREPILKKEIHLLKQSFDKEDRL